MELAQELGRRLGVPVELVTYDAAGKVTDAANTGAWDIAFVAIALVRVPTSPAAVEALLKDKLDAAAGVRAPLVRFAAVNPGVRVIDGRFMAIEQAMGTPRGREAGARYLGEFIEEMKASGFVAQGLQRSGQADAMVAPPAR